MPTEREMLITAFTRIVPSFVFGIVETPIQISMVGLVLSDQDGEHSVEFHFDGNGVMTGVSLGPVVDEAAVAACSPPAAMTLQEAIEKARGGPAPVPFQGFA